MQQVIGRATGLRRQAEYLMGLGAPVPFEHFWQAPDQHVEEAADDQPEHQCCPDEQPGMEDQELVQGHIQNAVPSWKIGRYMAITSAPTMLPSTTMISGSIRLLRLSTRLSTSVS